ncbi:hypothetical protein FraQA3DRAFT_4671 [Frankia sp. QA3]|nr:hypothetical protein FraQA3DRAFT_4671 [Frankia sp. QA3]
MTRITPIPLGTATQSGTAGPPGTILARIVSCAPTLENERRWKRSWMRSNGGHSGVTTPRRSPNGAQPMSPPWRRHPWAAHSRFSTGRRNGGPSARVGIRRRGGGRWTLTRSRYRPANLPRPLPGVRGIHPSTRSWPDLNGECRSTRLMLWELVTSRDGGTRPTRISSLWRRLIPPVLKVGPPHRAGNRPMRRPRHRGLRNRITQRRSGPVDNGMANRRRRKPRADRRRPLGSLRSSRTIGRKILRRTWPAHPLKRLRSSRRGWALTSRMKEFRRRSRPSQPHLEILRSLMMETVIQKLWWHNATQ